MLYIHQNPGDHSTHGGEPRSSRRWWLRPHLDNHRHRSQRERLKFSQLCLARDPGGGARGPGLLAPGSGPRGGWGGGGGAGGDWR